MTYSHSIPATVQIRLGHLLGLIGVAAALAACVTWAVTTFAFDTGTSGVVSSQQATATRAAQQGSATFTLTRKQIEGLSTMAQQDPATFTATKGQTVALPTLALQNVRPDDPIMWMTPAQLAGLGLGIGYQPRNAQTPPTADAILASMSPEARRYNESIMNLTFNELAAGAAGQP